MEYLGGGSLHHYLKRPARLVASRSFGSFAGGILRELAFWQRERENMGRIAQEVKSAPLGETVAKQDRRLEEADDEIAAMKKKIQSVKAAIHRNDDKIAKLLDMVVTPA